MNEPHGAIERADTTGAVYPNESARSVFKASRRVHRLAYLSLQQPRYREVVAQAIYKASAKSVALSRLEWAQTGRLLFSAGALGTSMVAAIVCSLLLAWGLGEVAGYRRSLEDRPASTPWSEGASVTGSAYAVRRTESRFTEC